MKNRLLITAFSMIICGLVTISCSKEKIQPNQTAGKVVNENLKSSGTTSATVTTSSDSHSGCSGGHGDGNGTGAYQGH